MIEGSDQLDASSCDDDEAALGLRPEQATHRSSATRTTTRRRTTEAGELLDSSSITINTNVKDIFDKIEAGELEGEFAARRRGPARVLDRPGPEGLSRSNAGDRTWYITMNLTQPPFDDIHVRKAANQIMDKEGLQRAWGGPIRGEIANHIVPDAMFNDDSTTTTRTQARATRATSRRPRRR